MDTTISNCLTPRGQRRHRLNSEQRVASDDGDRLNPYGLMIDTGGGLMGYSHRCFPQVI